MVVNRRNVTKRKVMLISIVKIVADGRRKRDLSRSTTIRRLCTILEYCGLNRRPQSMEEEGTTTTTVTIPLSKYVIEFTYVAVIVYNVRTCPLWL